MQTYVLKLDCETCGEPMTNRVADLTGEPGREVVVDVAMLSQESFECGNCGGATYLGDIEDMVHHEPGEEPEEEDEE